MNRKILRKAFIIAMCALLALALTGCGTNSGSNSGSD